MLFFNLLMLFFYTTKVRVWILAVNSDFGKRIRIRMDLEVDGFGGGRIIDNLQIDNLQIDNWQIDNQNLQIDNLQISVSDPDPHESP